MNVKPSLDLVEEDMEIILFSYPFYTNILHSTNPPSAIGCFAHMKSFKQEGIWIWIGVFRTFKYLFFPSQRFVATSKGSRWANTIERLRCIERKRIIELKTTTIATPPSRFSNPVRSSVSCEANNSKFTWSFPSFRYNCPSPLKWQQDCKQQMKIRLGVCRFLARFNRLVNICVRRCLPSYEHRVENDTERPHVSGLSRVSGVCTKNFRRHVSWTASFVLQWIFGGVIQHDGIFQWLEFDLCSRKKEEEID